MNIESFEWSNKIIILTKEENEGGTNCNTISLMKHFCKSHTDTKYNEKKWPNEYKR